MKPRPTALFENKKFKDEDEKFRWLLEVELLITMTFEIQEWIKCILPDETIRFETIFLDLRDGVILCRISQLLQRFFNHQHKLPGQANLLNFIHHDSCLKDRSGFKSRVNISTFLQWCRDFKINESVLFDTNDCYESAVMGRRQLIICLWYIAKEFYKYGAPIPKMLEYQMTKQPNQEGKTINLTDVYLDYITSNSQSFDVHKEMESQLPDINMKDYIGRLETEKQKRVSAKLASPPLAQVVTEQPNKLSSLIDPIDQSPSSSESEKEDQTSSSQFDSVENNFIHSEPTLSGAQVEVANLNKSVKSNDYINEQSKDYEPSSLGPKTPYELFKNTSFNINTCGKAFLYFREKRYSVLVAPNNLLFVRVGGGFESMEHFLHYKLRILSQASFNVENIECSLVSSTIKKDKLFELNDEFQILLRDTKKKYMKTN